MRSESFRKLLLICVLFVFAFGSAYGQDSLLVLRGGITKIVDGDTVDVQLTSGPIRVRLHGVDTPERGQPWSAEAIKVTDGDGV